jgi:hypothetical protein
MARTLPKFRAWELIARTPYQSWEQAAYFKADRICDGRSRAERLFHTVNADRAEQDNGEWHIIILNEEIGASGVRLNPIGSAPPPAHCLRLVPAVLAAAGAGPSSSVRQRPVMLTFLLRPAGIGHASGGRLRLRSADNGFVGG